MKTIIPILIFLFFGKIISAQSDTTKNVGNDSIVYSYAQTMPIFQGDVAGFQKYLKHNVHYPYEAMKTRTQGTVYLGFIVETNGSISNIHVEKSSGNESLDAEAIRVVSGMPPDWTSGMQDGKKVRVSIVQPVKFILN